MAHGTPSEPGLADPSSADTIDIQIACHCKKSTLAATVARAALPLVLEFCHCGACRRVTGQLAATLVELPEGVAVRQVGDGPVTRYNSSRELARFFCGACGSELYEQTTSGAFYIAAGCIKTVTDGGAPLYRLSKQIFAASSGDGGLRDFMLDAFDAPAYTAWPEDGKGEQLPKGKFLGPPAAPPPPAPGAMLPARCHCGGVRFAISAPNADSVAAVADEMLDLLVPFHADPALRPNKGNDPFWLRQNRTKYIAGLCVCDDCRTATGHEVQAWAWIPTANVHIDPAACQTLKRYKSSPHAWRDFCGECGATVFFGTEATPTLLPRLPTAGPGSGGRRDLVDVSVGLLASSAGAHAEDWLDWHWQRLSYVEKADNPDFARALEAGLRRWGEARAVAVAGAAGM